jgi:hypothetical protein
MASSRAQRGASGAEERAKQIKVGFGEESKAARQASMQHHFCAKVRRQDTERENRAPWHR